MLEKDHLYAFIVFVTALLTLVIESGCYPHHDLELREAVDDESDEDTDTLP